MFFDTDDNRNFAGHMDFINVTQFVNFTPYGPLETVTVKVEIVDDDIVEADETFVCMVELIDDRFAATVNIITPLAVVRIISNDGKYMFTSC